jgi:hypothetical protein
VIEKWNINKSTSLTPDNRHLGVFQRFSKSKTLLGISSFDALKSLNVYILTKAWTCFSSNLLLWLMWSSGYGRKNKHTCITFIAKSKIKSKEKIKLYNNQIKLCTCMDMMDIVR